MNAKLETGDTGETSAPKAPQCQGAVVRAYDNLRTAGVEDEQAFLATARIYRTHHPEADLKIARSRIAGWIYDRPQDS
jgi:hypothetical protein